MNDEQTRSRQRSDEAAAWMARLSADKISNTDLDAFWTWRRDPLNRAAYEKIEIFNSAARGLRDDPDMKAAVREAMTRRPWWREALAAMSSKRGGYALGALAAAALAIVVVVPGLVGERHSTTIGEQITVRLDDGSKVQLNTDSRLRVRFTKGERRLVLERGQAFFDVAHDAARPFIVDAGEAQVRAVGTRFDVRRAANDVDVTLAQGRVEVTPAQPGAHTWTLAPGQHIRIADRQPIEAPSPIDLAATTAWTTGRIYFHDASLADAVAEVNRYCRKKIVLGDGAPADRKINGAFETGDTEGFVTAVAAGLGLEVVRKPGGRIELRAHQTSGA